ncbi:uncharacterized protein BP01DRAFT_390892 [Aspergillus saccharolyticus JOP 1030-1]|uniref:Uncharacterized protein n=1 Tax=Aspergillus saccharolyticus JOP 1030-1 TaxID=1450539 RepID=A0A318ZGG8_9EURO|nr:hypothetical protein BP01DRAFT_390892 [Aspergillus saccharolyticus JOP 1030-1]PYH46656.1 hypothetical protein BP01DRAFT_390892 [Aspergillus saccharolyticus JOP 1030-1]
MMLPFVHRLRGIRRPSDPPGNNSGNGGGELSQDDMKKSNDDAYYPSCYDVLKVRYLLQHIWKWKRNSEELFPVELVDMIVDAAEYWATSESGLEGETIIRKDQDQALLTTVPLCYDVNTLDSDSPQMLPHRTVHPCRKIIFSILAHDQGWGGGARNKGPYDGSYTWFDTQIIHSAQKPPPCSEEATQGVQHVHFESGNPLLLPSPHKLQSNRTADKNPQLHRITWHYLDDVPSESSEAEDIENSTGRGRATLDGSQVRSLEVGDAIQVWGRARFGGWINHVQRVSVRVFWAV